MEFWWGILRGNDHSENLGIDWRTILQQVFKKCVGRVAQSVQRLAMGWTVRGSNSNGARFSAPVQTGPGAHPAASTVGTGSFPGVKSSRNVILTPHPLLVPWSQKDRALPLLPLWAVQPVQGLSACTTVHFTFLPLPSRSGMGGTDLIRPLGC